MKLVTIIPVGPGHEEYAEDAAASAHEAWKTNHGPFTEADVVLVSDTQGRLGRGRARNKGMDEHPADWHFLLDADDLMLPGALPLLNESAAATFGAVMLNGAVSRHNIWPLSRQALRYRGALGTLSMGCFVRGNLGLRFNEQMDVAEDFDFYMRLPSFTKVRSPLVSIGYGLPSATGPRGYDTIDWVGECNKIIANYLRAE